MTITRKRFLSAATGGTVLLLLQGCGGGGGDDDDDDNGGPPTGSCGASGNEIAGNHGHTLSIPAADLTATTNRTYSITGTANHTHSVTFTPAQLAMLDAGQSVMVISTVNSSHDHAVTASCA